MARAFDLTVRNPRNATHKHSSHEDIFAEAWGTPSTLELFVENHASTELALTDVVLQVSHGLPLRSCWQERGVQQQRVVPVESGFGRGHGNSVQCGRTAVASISSRAWGSTRPLTCTTAIVG